MTPGSPGRKGRSGWGSTEAGRSIRSIPKREPFFAPSNPTASLPASPGSTTSSGTAPGKATRRRAADRSANRTGPGEARDAARRGRVGARVRWRRSVLLRRRKQREGESHPSTQARLRGQAEKVRTSCCQITRLSRPDGVARHCDGGDLRVPAGLCGIKRCRTRARPSAKVRTLRDDGHRSCATPNRSKPSTTGSGQVPRWRTGGERPPRDGWSQRLRAGTQAGR